MDELQDILRGLSKEEQAAVIQILKEQEQSGISQSYDNLISADYDEVPVSVQEFITNPKYAGNYLQTYYDFWKEQLINIFDGGKHYSEIAFTGSIGTGKVNSIQTPLLGASGWFLMQDAKPGMKVFGEDGKLHTILKIWPNGTLPVYKVTFSDGSWVECGLDHNWTVRDYTRLKKQVNNVVYDRWVTMTTKEIMDKGLWAYPNKKDKNGNKQRQRRFAIPVTQPIQFEPKGELPIHPYVLGQLISDGSISTNSLSLHAYENDVADKFNGIINKYYSCELIHDSADEKEYGDYRVVGIHRGSNVLIKKIQQLGINTTAPYKHIPEVYLYASVEDRIQLLQGLFDGDGSIQEKRYTYSTVSEKLYEDMIFLIESLGGSVFRTRGKPCWRTVDGVKHFTGNKCWEFQFKLPDAIKPFTSKKHEKRYGGGTKFDTSKIYRFIDKIEYVRDDECQCITVDNPSGLYITKDFIVTHNSSMAIVGMAYVLYQLMCLKNPQKYWGTNKTMYFAFFNNNLELAKSVGFAAFHDLIRKSEWFLDHGEFRGKVNQIYHPYKDIELMAGSLPSHVIGKDVFCLTGDTKVITDRGIYRIDELARLGLNNLFRVKQVANDGEIVWSNSCLARQTKVTTKLFNIIFENGASIRCTPDHLFLREDLNYSHGYDLTSGDYVYAECGNSKKLRIKEIQCINFAAEKPVYDVICAYPFNNFGVSLGDDIVFVHNCALQDELNFGQGSSVHLEQNKILLTYNSIYERIASRFTRDGINWGTMFLVSSKKSEYDFLESYIRKQKGKPHFYVADAKLWDVKPSAMYSGKKFNLAVGGSNLPSKIIPDNENPHDYVLQGYEVIQVPIEHKQSFELDMQSAIMNVAGISISQFLKFMNIEQIQKCYTDDENPFVQEVIPIGLKDSALISDYFRPELVPEEIYSRPIFIHLDMAVSGDNAGIGAVASMGFVNTSEYDINQGKVVETKKMAYRHVFSVGISAPKNDQIHFAKVREFLYWLKFHLGWNIRGISADGFNCLTSLNRVITNNGEKCITDIDPLVDKVLSYDIESDGFVYTNFENLRQSGTATELVRIYTSKENFIECTPYHLILTSHGYVQAKDITEDTFISTLDLNLTVYNAGTVTLRRKYHKVYKVEYLDCQDSPVPVYDIEVPQHNNFVLSDGSVVHNSVDMRQQLSTMGFNDVSLISLDRTSDGYMALRSAIAEKRIALLKLQHLEVELVQLERDNVSGKIDHPVNGCFTSDTEIRLSDGRDITIEWLITNGWKDLEVFSVNESTGIIETKHILNVFCTKISKVVELTLLNGRKIRCTKDHLFLLRDRTYKSAKDLTELDELFTGSRVASMKYLPDLHFVYDLTIEDNPNFMLSAGVFAHNSKDEADGLAGALYNALLHEKDLANDMSDLVSVMVDMNSPVSSTASVITSSSQPVVEPQKLTKQQIIEEARRRANINYGRDRVEYIDEDDEPFNPSEGILF